MKTTFALIVSLALTGYATAQEEQQNQGQGKPGVLSQSGASAGRAAGAAAGTAVGGPIVGAVTGAVGGTVGGTVGKVVEGKPKENSCDWDESATDKACEKKLARQQNTEPSNDQ